MENLGPEVDDDEIADAHLTIVCRSHDPNCHDPNCPEKESLYLPMLVTSIPGVSKHLVPLDLEEAEQLVKNLQESIDECRRKNLQLKN